MGYFYSYMVSTWSHDNEEFNDNGVSINKWTKTAELECDLQPVDLIKVKQSYGYDIDAQYVVFTDYPIKESDMVLYNKETYKVKHLIAWENNGTPFTDFYETYIKKFDYDLKHDEVEGTELEDVVIDNRGVGQCQ